MTRLDKLAEDFAPIGLYDHTRRAMLAAVLACLAEVGNCECLDHTITRQRLQRLFQDDPKLEPKL